MARATPTWLSLWKVALYFRELHSIGCWAESVINHLRFRLAPAAMRCALESVKLGQLDLANNPTTRYRAVFSSDEEVMNCFT